MNKESLPWALLIGFLYIRSQITIYKVSNMLCNYVIKGMSKKYVSQTELPNGVSWN